MLGVMHDVAALYVLPDGPYPARCVSWYDEGRDARTYSGSLPVVAHPPCKRWGRWWYAAGDSEPGNDGGLFSHALREVERCGGVLEHPESTHAWARFGIEKPPRGGGWIRSRAGWTCCVAQRNYGHKARKYTWLYYVGPEPPELTWGPGPKQTHYLTKPGRRRGRPGKDVPLLTRRENLLTPVPFAELLIGLAEKTKTSQI